MREQVLSGGKDGWLIVLENESVVGPLFIEDLLGGLILSMHGIGSDHPPVQIERIEQLAQSRDFVGLAGHRPHAQAAQGRDGDGGD